ncbi:MAG: hypothetical protein JO165_01380, partial [Candidatus Eremiobacteraeota bacterium]|nr:hypothetical protein [Candidatus Eremiobacteraeota bacterium]
MDSIRMRSVALRAQNNVRPLVLSAAIALATIATAAAYAPALFHGVQLFIFGEKIAVAIDSFTMVREPTRSDLENVVKRASFPVILPVGLPNGMHISRMMFAPSDRPNTITLLYSNGRGFSIFDSSAVVTNNPVLPKNATKPVANVYRWNVGRETVLTTQRYMNDSYLNRVKSAMAESTPAQSLAATEAMLSKAMIVGASPVLPEIAALYAPQSGHGVVIGPQFVRNIPNLAKSQLPIDNTNTVDLTTIPFVDGEP